MEINFLILSILEYSMVLVLFILDLKKKKGRFVWVCAVRLPFAQHQDDY